MNIVDKFISVNYSSGRGGKQPIRITCHTCVCSATSLYSWFNTPTAKASTSFYVNKGGVVERYVRDTDTAWGNSNFDSNQRSFSFETYDGGNPNDSVRTDELYESSAQLIAYLSKTYNIPVQLVPKDKATDWSVKGIDLHNYFNPNKSCPASLDINRIIQRANLILNQTPMIDASVQHDGSNLQGYKMNNEQATYETNKLNTDFGGDLGKWYEKFRLNEDCQTFDIGSLNDQMAAQDKTIADQKATIDELNRTLDMRQAQIDKLQAELTACQAGNSGGTVINLFGFKIIFIRNK